MIKSIFVFIFLTSFSLSGFTQSTSGEWINLSDTTEILKILNGEWKTTAKGKKIRFNFNFDDRYLNCVDSVNNNWEEYPFYHLVISENDKIGLMISPHPNSEPFSELEIWIVDRNTIVIDLGPDYGKHIMKKRK